jgi:hypothetical protein
MNIRKYMCGKVIFLIIAVGYATYAIVYAHTNKGNVNLSFSDKPKYNGYELYIPLLIAVLFEFEGLIDEMVNLNRDRIRLAITNPK